MPGPIPEPSADQFVPFQRAIRFALTPPAIVNVPPATRSPFGNVVRADTAPLVQPVPSADQPAPSHRAVLLALATRSPFGSVVSATTAPFMPEPSADQLAPFQRAMLRAGAPSAR